MTSSTDFTMVVGVMPCSSLYWNWVCRRRSISSSARDIEAVT